MSGEDELYIGRMSLRRALGQVSTRILLGGSRRPQTVGLFVQHLETESLKTIQPTEPIKGIRFAVSLLDDKEGGEHAE